MLVRNPSRLPEDLAAQVKVIQGDSTCREDVAKAVDGQDGVVVALGTGRDLGTIYSAMKHNIYYEIDLHMLFYSRSYNCYV